MSFYDYKLQYYTIIASMYVVYKRFCEYIKSFYYSCKRNAEIDYNFMKILYFVLNIITISIRINKIYICVFSSVRLNYNIICTMPNDTYIIHIIYTYT